MEFEGVAGTGCRGLPGDACEAEGGSRLGVVFKLLDVRIFSPSGCAVKYGVEGETETLVMELECARYCRMDWREGIE